MTLRATLGEVVDMVRHEAQLSTNTSRGIDHRDAIVAKIKRAYYTMAEDFDWQHLELKKESDVSRKILQAGSNTYGFPAAVNPLKISKVWVKWGSSWLPVDYGIKHEHYSAYDPDADQRGDPVTNWAFYNGDGFEVWPLPASNGVADGNNEIAFEGQKKVETLTADASRLDVDDQLIALQVATEIMATQGQKDGASVLAEAATRRLQTLRGNLGSKTRYRMGIGPVNASGALLPRHPLYIR